MRRRISIFFYCCFICCNLKAQSYVFENQFQSNIDIDIKPRLFFTNTLLGSESRSTYLIGANIKLELSKKTNFSYTFDHLSAKNNIPIFQEFKDSLTIYPGFGKHNNRSNFNLNFNLNKFFKVKAGVGKQFIGNGYRSLLLSDLSSSYPFLQIKTSTNKFDYYNFYTKFENNVTDNSSKIKYASIHYLNLKLSSKINIGIYEAVLWPSKNKNQNIGYEISYLNPIIFYRPIEFSMGSEKGNALMGTNLTYTLKKIKFYAQFVLDDLNISRRKDSDPNYQEGFIQNKYGYQIGTKIENKNLHVNIEYNQIQPYTYGHRSIIRNYTHMNQSLAHPLGANFKELISFFKYDTQNYLISLKTMIVGVGLDSIDTHYGQNIFDTEVNSSTGGSHSYGNYNGQGVYTNIILIRPEFSYKFKYFDLFSSIYLLKKKSDLVDQTSMYLLIGIRNIPFSIFPF
ncbi:MAG: hypothetical protein CMD36_00920 [Flavobacteriales bacterium]|nr:hypothetical protein [Flavobacteriales bacterium]|tara:strand:- start:601 stop:1962 length:1362 start_codon:yes stop_codon:yes gene_type:complete